MQDHHPARLCAEFTDGIDVVSTDGLTIDGCFAYCNDDCFAWGNTCCFAPPLLELAQSRELSHCVVRGMVGWNPRANGIRFGSSTMCSTVGIRDLMMENCDFCGMYESRSSSAASPAIPRPRTRQATAC